MTSIREEARNRLIANQLGYTLDLIKSELVATQVEQVHTTGTCDMRLKPLETQAKVLG